MPQFPPEEILTPSAVLRCYQGDETPALLEAVEESLDHLRPWMPWASAEPLEAGLAEFVQRSVHEFAAGENFSYAIWALDEAKLIGGTGLHPRLGSGRMEIGYWIRVGWLRRGVATAVTRALTSAAFALADIDQVVIHCDEANVISAKVPAGLGFHLIRVVEDDVQAPGEVGSSMEWVMDRAEREGA